MKYDYSDERYNECHSWLEKKRNHKTNRYTWDELKMACKENETGLQEFLARQTEDNDWPELSVEDWRDFVAYYQDEEERTKPCIIPEEKSVSGMEDKTEPTSVLSAWQKYKKHLMETNGFSRASVQNIKESALGTLNRLNDGSLFGDPVKGLVVGNVQSGKTANMGALISMAADYGWNMFIILTGTIENLRLQTQRRFKDDLQNGNITWESLEHPGRDQNSRLCNLKLADSGNNRVRYITCCLKNGVRLEKLYKWLNSDKNKKPLLKILLIDDEADQASLNTKNMEKYEEERTRINQQIMNIVNNTGKMVKATETDRYAAVNYVAYTATPYGNFLNESGDESLYPRDFISVLEPSDLYFGPQQIFGDSIRHKWDGMPILNVITGDYKRGKTDDADDIDILNQICAKEPVEIPESLKDAVAWFCIAAAIRREEKSSKPVTMLVHHTMNTDGHSQMGTAIKTWLEDLPAGDFVARCEVVYKKQTEALSKDVFCQVCEGYGDLSGLDLAVDIKDYPAFGLLREHILTLHKTVRHIYMDDDATPHYHQGIHLCIDNCKYEAVAGDEDTSYVRLLYPENEECTEGFAPAFLVVGGNTLSRGLTLEGLVCTYFSREVRQADSLMQMGRWFGYRRGYELLPRIWLTTKGQERFEFLTELDTDLRTNLTQYRSQVTPKEYGPLIMNTPGVSFMTLTSAGKSQNMTEADMNFAGANLQTIHFQNDKVCLEKHLELADRFIGQLGEPAAGLSDGARKVWENIGFDRIWNGLLADYKYNLSQIEDMDTFRQWVESLDTENKLDKWSVVLSGRKKDKKDRKAWNGVGMIQRTRKISGMHTRDSRDFCIGILSDPSDWCADIENPEKLDITEEDRKILFESGKKEKTTMEAASREEAKMRAREAAGKGNTPLLIIYCIDKDSAPGKYSRESENPRMPLNAEADVIGLYVRIPGQRVNKEYCAKVTIRMKEQEIQ